MTPFALLNPDDIKSVSSIIKKEEIEVDEREVQEKIAEISSKHDRKTAEKFKKDVAHMEWIREDLRFEKLMTWLMKNNRV